MTYFTGATFFIVYHVLLVDEIADKIVSARKLIDTTVAVVSIIELYC